MSLLAPHLLRHEFPAIARTRGKAYFESGRVDLHDADPNHVEATVIGTQAYDVEANWLGPEPDDVELWCDCPAYDKWGPCKHVWAVLLALEEVVGPAESKSATNATRRAWPPKGVKRPAPKQDPEWMQRVQAMHSMDSRLGRTIAFADPDRRIVYELDVQRTLRDGRLALQVFELKRRKQGDWGEPRLFEPKRGLVSPAETPLDTRIFTRLLGASGGRDLDGWGDGSSFILSAAFSDEVLPLLCGSERLFHDLSQNRAEARPLRFDDGAPWQFEGCLDEGPRELALIGELVRGKTRRSLGEPVVLTRNWVVFPEEVARFDPCGAMSVVKQLRSLGPIRVPKAERAKFEFALRSLPGGAWRSMPWLPPPEVAAPIAQLHLEGNLTGGHRARRLDCSLTFAYGSTHLTVDDSREVFLSDGGRVVGRDFDAERAALEELSGLGVRLSLDWEDATGTVTVGSVIQVAHTLVERGWVVTADGLPLRKACGASVSVRSGLDWFELEGGMQFGTEVAPFPELLAAASKGHNVVRLGDGSLGVLPENWLKQWSLLELGEGSEHGVRFPRQRGWILDALLAEREGVSCDADFERYRRGLANFRGLKPRKEPATFRGTLRDYQRVGLGMFRFWSTLGLGGCLADDMGLGKTVQVLALLESRRAKSRPEGQRPSLVVAPRSVLFNWIDEAARFTPKLCVADHTGTGRNARRAELEQCDLIVTTYGTLRRDAAELSELQFDYAILDEAQTIKNASSQTAKAARLLRAEHRLALSGTPVENHIGELWSLFEFLNPGMLGRSKRFQELVGGAGADTERLSRAMRPFFLRRTKAEVLDDLPDKTEQVLYCDLGKTERRRYDELRKHYRAELLGRADDVGLNRMKIHVLEALLRLRQCACHPGLLAADRRHESSAKLDVLIPRLQETASEGHKALVFSQFTKLLGILRERLDALGIAYEYLDGRTQKRKQRVERFQSDPACPLFLISLKAGGHGLNLTAADNVFLLDPWWNPAVEAQAIDRAHRIGRTRPVFAYRMIARDTVEERVVELQEKKRALAEALFAGQGGALREMTRGDLEELLA